MGQSFLELNSPKELRMFTVNQVHDYLQRRVFLVEHAKRILTDSFGAPSASTGMAAHPEQHVFGAAGGSSNLELGASYQLRNYHSQFDSLEQQAKALRYALMTQAGKDCVRALNSASRALGSRITLHMDVRHWVGKHDLGDAIAACLPALPFGSNPMTIAQLTFVLEKADRNRLHVQTAYPAEHSMAKLITKYPGHSAAIVGTTATGAQRTWFYISDVLTRFDPGRKL
jgi:hypothetical protein